MTAGGPRLFESRDAVLAGEPGDHPGIGFVEDINDTCDGARKFGIRDRNGYISNWTSNLPMTHWIKRIHMYTGLLSFTVLVVFGIAGITATIQPERPTAGPTETRDFQVPANASDFDAATAAWRSLQLPQSQAPPRGAVHRDAQNHVSFTLYSPNGPRIVTLLESEHQARIELRKNHVWHFLENVHAMTPREVMPGVPERLWSWYTELGIWALIFMSLSGVWLWLVSRPGYRWAQFSFAAGSGVFIVLYALTR